MQLQLHGKVELIDNHRTFSPIAFVIMVILFTLVVLVRGVCGLWLDLIKDRLRWVRISKRWVPIWPAGRECFSHPFLSEFSACCLFLHARYQLSAQGDF